MYHCIIIDNNCAFLNYFSVELYLHSGLLTTEKKVFLLLIWCQPTYMLEYLK